MFGPGGHGYAATTGRYAGRKAAAYARQVGSATISGEQVAREKVCVYAPINRDEGIEWKELHAGIARVMQMFCSDYKTEAILKMGLDSLKQIEEEFVPRLYALDPHKLVRSLEDLSLLTYGQIVIQASLARQASSEPLGFNRIDYPEIDPPAWNKFITIQLENGQMKTGELPLQYWGNMKANYEAHNQDYTGVYK
jgi:succinate dehydrogenase/fumarate reductase flavoprotein subunit